MLPEKTSPLAQEKTRLIFASSTLLAVLLGCIWILPIERSASANSGGSAAAPAAQDAGAKAPISIDYPEEGSIFPPGITPPTFLFRDPVATSWRVKVTFVDKAPALHAMIPQGERMKIGPIDPETVADTNEPPKLNEQIAESWTWIPDAATWSAIQQHSVTSPATVTITGYNSSNAAVSASHTTFTTSKDPVGAPIFFRDVPLMPSAGADGVIQPLSRSAGRLVHWSIRDITQPASHIAIKSVPTCLNCHSFSADGKTMGIDVDGPGNDKGMYAILPVSKHMVMDNKNVVRWNMDGQVGTTRVGFMSRVSPDGKYVLSSFAPPSEGFSTSYYTVNYTDYHFLQTFYPTRGILEWYSPATGRREPLPGAADPNYVQTGGVWSADGKWIVFARAQSKNPVEVGQPKALRSQDPNETQIKYDLYRIPFNDGRGGVAEPIQGASENGMSNNMPKISPDGRWIVFVQCKNGEVLRPDSKLYIVPFEGGEARPLRSNAMPMNSWHSFSPNGRWLVFSSKRRGPYTQMYLTHIGEDGNSSPAIVIDNATASNRAVNLPEFANIPGDGIEEIQTPAIDGYRMMDQALNLESEHKYAEALAIWRKAAEMEPDDATVQTDISANLYLSGSVDEAIEHARDATRINPAMVQPHYYLGAFLLSQGHPDQAVSELETTVNLSPRYASGEDSLATACAQLGRETEALLHWRKAIALEPERLSALLGAARILSSSPEPNLRSGTEAVALAEKANQLTQGSESSVLDALGAAYAEAGKFPQALDAANRALSLADAKGDSAAAGGIRYRISLYSAEKPFHYSIRVNVSKPNTANGETGSNSPGN
jgi:tetratricopeptide (TPR) repeat protein